MIDTIPTSVSQGERRELRALAAGRRVLECGSSLGQSAIAMAQSAHVVWTVDRHKDWSIDSLASLRVNLGMYGAKDRVLLIVGEFVDVLPELPANWFTFGFLDGFDGAGEVARNIGLMERCLTPSALLVIHDYNSDAVRNGLDLPTVNHWKLRETVETLAILERRPNGR